MTDQGARQARYREALRDAYRAHLSPNFPPTDGWANLTSAVLPLVDAEVAAAVSEAQAEIERLSAGADETPVPENAWPNAGQLWARLIRDDRDERLRGLDLLIEEASNGHFLRMRNDAVRAESAEAEVERLREDLRIEVDLHEEMTARWLTLDEGIRALADEWESVSDTTLDHRYWYHAERLRALLYPSPAATTGEADVNLGRVFSRGRAARPAPVSSGEAATGARNGWSAR